MRLLKPSALALCLVLLASALTFGVTQTMQNDQDKTAQSAASAGGQDQSITDQPTAAAPAKEDYAEIAPPGTALVMKMQAAPGSKSADSQTVQLNAVYSDQPGNANADWSKWTPSAGLTATISNPGAFDRIQPGEEYFIFIVPANPAKRG